MSSNFINVVNELESTLLTKAAGKVRMLGENWIVVHLLKIDVTIDAEGLGLFIRNAGDYTDFSDPYKAVKIEWKHVPENLKTRIVDSMVADPLPSKVNDFLMWKC